MKEVYHQIRTISSSGTFLAKVVFPILWIIGFGVGTLSLWLGHFWDKPPQQIRYTLLSLWILGSVFLLHSIKLKRVRLDTTHIYVCNYLREVPLPFGLIKDVTENRWWKINHVYPITIYFRNTTAFGNKITFLPQYVFSNRYLSFSHCNDPHPIVNTLKQLAGLKKGEPEIISDSDRQAGEISSKTGGAHFYYKTRTPIPADIRDEILRRMENDIQNHLWWAEATHLHEEQGHLIGSTKIYLLSYQSVNNEMIEVDFIDDQIMGWNDITYILNLLQIYAHEYKTEWIVSFEGSSLGTLNGSEKDKELFHLINEYCLKETTGLSPEDPTLKKKIQDIDRKYASRWP